MLKERLRERQNQRERERESWREKKIRGEGEKVGERKVVRFESCDLWLVNKLQKLSMERERERDLLFRLRERESREKKESMRGSHFTLSL